jgi:leader peptidase (prepilin peptidase)/N-methyltransferase
MARGRCAQCSERLTARIPIVEFVTGAFFAALYLSCGITWELLILLVYTSLLIVLFITDYEHFLLPNIVTYPGIVLAASVALLVTLLQYRLSWAVFFAGQDFMSMFNNYFLCAMAGGIAGALLLLLVVVLSRGGMGMGDVKLAGLLGLMVGFPLVFIALFVGVWAGGLVAVALLVSGRKKRKEMLPFGPFLCIGGLTALLWGRQILAWYLGFI